MAARVEKDGEDIPLRDTSDKATKTETGDLMDDDDESARNVYVAARGRIQRYVDVALLMSNMSQLATVIKRANMFTTGQYIALVSTLSLAMTAEIIAAILFFITHEKDMSITASKKPESAEDKRYKRRLDIAAYACVGVVMLFNLFASTFIASWTESVPDPPLLADTSAGGPQVGMLQYNTTLT